MCGITGYFSKTPYPREVLEEMTRTIDHRGPDDRGYFVDGPLNFGHTRLSIVDIAGSPQPLFNEDRTIAVVFNGEIYNYQGLRESLLSLGHEFRTEGDGEVLVHAWEEYGEAMLDMVSGMFAFALWDCSRQTLFLARDHLGVKPLYYYSENGLFAFGSELKAIVRHPGVRKDIDLDAIALFLECQYIPAPRSIYRQIRKLPAGHCLRLTPSGMTTRRYWNLDYRAKLEVDRDGAIGLVEAGLKKSVASMLMSDVPLGAFVSGGIDSSLVAALMTECSGQPVDTFNLGFDDDTTQSEHEQAALVARHIGSRHHVCMIGTNTVLGALDRWVDVFDEPFGDQAALPTLLLAEFARKTVKVVLTGEGADEVFSGYGNYQKRIREERWTRILGASWSPLHRLAPLLPAQLRKDRMVRAIGLPLDERYVTIPGVFDEALRPALFAPALARERPESLRQYAAAYYRECNSTDYHDHLLHIDTSLWLPDDLLTKVDRATMACSLEARVPYLDKDFVQECARLPSRWKREGGITKYVLKQVAEKYLPPEIVHRRKQGFVMPLNGWLRNELAPTVSRCLSGSGLLKRNLLNRDTVGRLLADHQARRKDHSVRLWALLALELWFQRYAPDFAL